MQWRVAHIFLIVINSFNFFGWYIGKHIIIFAQVVLY